MQKRIKILSEEESKCAQLYKLPIGQTQGCSSGVNYPGFYSLISTLPAYLNKVIRAGFIKNTHLYQYLPAIILNTGENSRHLCKASLAREQQVYPLKSEDPH